MAIKGISGRVNTSGIEPVVRRSRAAGLGATPALQSSSGLTGRPMPPDAIPRLPTLAELLRRKDAHTGQDRQMDASPSLPASHAAARPAASEASGGSGEPAAPGPRLTRSPHGRHREDSPLRAVAEQWQLENSRGAHRAGSSAVSEASGGTGKPAAPGPRLTRSLHGRPHANSPVHAIADQWQAEESRRSQGTAPSPQPRQSTAPARPLPTIREERKVRFAGAEQRAFDPDDQRKALEEPVRVPFPSEAVVAARPKSLARSSSEVARANAAANGADQAAQERYVNQLGNAVGHLQHLAIQSPERVQQAIQRGVLPAEVLKDRLDPQFVEDVLDLHTQFQEAQAAAPALGQTTFSDPVGVATIIVDARQRLAAGAGGDAELLALMAEASGAAAPQALTADQVTMVTAALNGGGQALQRMSERAERANAAPAKTALGRLRQARGQPKPLEGARHKDFVALVDRDIAALVTKLKIEPRHAADLLQRAVHVGQMGADTLRPQDRALLLEVLAAKALNGGG